MTEFKIKLAKITIGVTSLFEETRDFCKEYLTENEPDFSVEMSAEDIIDERKRNARQMMLEGHAQADFSDSYMETLALYRKITDRLLSYNVLLFHGCVIAHNGKAYIFTARSGTGKTTHTQLWLDNIPNCHILNGDKPLLLFENDKAYACGTPWMGKEGIGINEILPIDGICILERDKVNHIEKINFTTAISELITQTHRPDGKVFAVMNLIKKMENIKIYRLGCNMDPQAAQVAYEGMVTEEND